ncbi:MAG: ribbon-helix-helix domain-containing protein [Gemmatimonadetes bacterium]|nr:ribbon-helix-helix domain-containing protein [Gemmatimonadota bacterium]MDE2734394.1 ribbon-helix-helix domain-containing protein [Gemmatimonadota bacterium]
MNTISLKVPDPLAAELAEMAQRRGVSKSALIRDALEAYLQTDGAEPSGSALSQVGDLRGILSGPEDLSANKDYLRKFGR